MINESLIKKFGFKLDIKEVEKRIHDFNITDKYKITINKIAKALKEDNIECAVDENWLSLKDEYHFKQAMEKLNNRIWLVKIARHRIFEDCKGCKFLKEEGPLGKMWCEKWDTDIWNIATPFEDNVVNKGCVPFRYFGYAPNVPESQSQFHTTKKASISKSIEWILKFADRFNIYEDLGWFTNENTLVGQWDDKSNFRIDYIKADNSLHLNVNYGNKSYEEKFPATLKGIDDMANSWKAIFETGKFAEDFKGNAPRQETSYDWDTSEEYKKKHNLQKTKQYETSPSNVDGEKYPPLENAFSEGDKNLSNF